MIIIYKYILLSTICIYVKLLQQSYFAVASSFFQEIVVPCLAFTFQHKKFLQNCLVPFAGIPALRLLLVITFCTAERSSRVRLT